ncbi:MAG: ion transporter [Gaiella sp.]
MPDPRPASGVLTNPGYEIFILAVSLLSLVNIALLTPISPLGPQQQDVLLFVDGVLLAVFLGDFLHRLRAADDRREYFLRGGGWLDLIGSLPFLRVFRLFRIVRVGKLLREFGVHALVRWLLRERAQSALYVVVFLVILVLEVTSVAVLPLEAGQPGATITSAGDALWWGIVTITTVGYGDEYPVSPGGRIVGTFLLLTGVALFATFTGFLANAFLRPTALDGADEGLETVPATPRTAIDELRAALDEQERSSARLRERLAALEAQLP